MTAFADWSGQAVKVTSKLVPRFLWQTASIDVYVNEKCVLQTGGQLKIVGSHTSEFTNGNQSHEAVLTWGYATPRSFPIELSIDGQRVLKSRVYTSNWMLGLLPWIALVLVLIYWPRIVQWIGS